MSCHIKSSIVIGYKRGLLIQDRGFGWSGFRYITIRINRKLLCDRWEWIIVKVVRPDIINLAIVMLAYYIVPFQSGIVGFVYILRYMIRYTIKITATVTGIMYRSLFKEYFIIASPSNVTPGLPEWGNPGRMGLQ